MRKFFIKLKNNIILLIIMPIMGLLALFLVHLLPTENIRQNILWSMDMIEKEFVDELVIDGYSATLTGNFTDCLMLEHAAYTNEEHTILEQILMMYRSETYYDEADPDGWWPGYSLKHYVEGISQPREVQYARYWHGYLVVLKPLLIMTNFNTLRLINSALQLILSGFIVMGCCKKNAYTVAKALIISLPFMFFVSTFASLSLSICMYIVLISILILLKWDYYIYEKELFAEFFLLIGIVTAYFDFLTYPLVTLVYPLGIYLFLYRYSLVTNFKKIFVYSLEWMIGYVGMWSSKWILADIFTDSNIIRDALTTIFIRTAGIENSTRIQGYLAVLSKNLDPFNNWCYLLILFFVFLFLVWKFIRYGLKMPINNFAKGVPYFVVAMFPFVWYFLLQNHSIQHWQFTCRIVASTIFAIVIGISVLFEKDQKSTESL